MDVFVSRESEAIIPNIFFFLVLLSYERYHSKQIIGIPKIIQLCDGIMASGRKAVTHGNGTNLSLWSSVMMCWTVLVFITPTSNCIHSCSVLCRLYICMCVHVCVSVSVCACAYWLEVLWKESPLLLSGAYNLLRGKAQQSGDLRYR